MMLSVFQGQLHYAALGAPLVTRETLATIFEVVATGGTETLDGAWSFTLLRNKRLSR
jgi:hypothetical protein